jgi:hypothetical protein
MAQQLYFSRDSQMFLEIGTSVWKIPVLEGFSFSQATNTSEITLAEMEAGDGTSRRGRRAFNDSLAPVDFSFSTYIRPFTAASGTAAGTADSAAKVHAVEEALWALFGGRATYASYAFTNQITPATAVSDLVFTDSNRSTLGPTLGANLYFELGDANKICYKLSKIAINEASIDFDIDGVAQINWSGFADTITDITKTVTVNGTISNDVLEIDGSVGFSAPYTGTDGADSADFDRRVHGTGVLADSYIDGVTDTDTASFNATQSVADDAILTLLGPRATVYEGITQTNNFIRNRLTKCLVNTEADPQSALENTYVLTLTGGTITLSNNITYLTPEELGTVNIPIGHVTGARAFGGSFTCYLTEDDTNSNSSRDFFGDLTSTAQRSEVTNDFKLTFAIGGGTVSGNAISDSDLADTALMIEFPRCHIDIPTHAIDDIVTLETTFMALPESIETADEMVMVYKGPAA